MESARYFLPEHVFLCSAMRYTVLLDLRRDSYTCIPRRLFAERAAILAAQGILTTEPHGSKPLSSVVIATPVREVARVTRLPAHIALAYFLPFFIACRRADSALKRGPFEHVVRAAAARRRGNHHENVVPLDRAIRLSRIFAALRLLYPRSLVCTFDSLALLEFLAAWRIYPQWVFGVRADPFQAHCWVQLGDALLNDRIERVVRLTPIMTV